MTTHILPRIRPAIGGIRSAPSFLLRCPSTRRSSIVLLSGTHSGVTPGWQHNDRTLIRYKHTRPIRRYEEDDDDTDSILPLTIHTGDPITDRKSTFQAHVATVHSLDDTRKMMQQLHQHSKIARAEHNIYAYTFTDAATGVVHHAHGDDGESGAGIRLSMVLQQRDVTDVMVVVTRWYGGVHLGNDRFRHILNVARHALDAHSNRIAGSAAAARPVTEKGKSHKFKR